MCKETNRIYNLVLGEKNNVTGIITALKMCAPSFAKTEEQREKWATECYRDRAISCNPNHPRYREMIEALENFGVAVFDAELTKIPDVEEIVNGQRCYT